MRILITGGTGFIGSHFINLAHANGHDVVALRRSPSSSPRVKLHREPEWIVAELGGLDHQSLSGCDAILHLAAHSMVPPSDTLENCLKWNVLAPLALFESAIASNISKIIVAGSCFEYGRSGERYKRLPVTAPLEPVNNYAISKATASMAFIQFARDKNIRLSVQRIFHVYGEGEDGSRFWPSLRRAAQNGEDFPMSLGEQIRDFVPVDVVVRSLLNALLTNLVPGKPEIKHIGTGVPSQLIDFAQKWWIQFGATGRLRVGALPYRPYEIMRYVPEI